jgi:hypothetical protein
MLIALRTGLRFRLAAAFAIFAALSFVAPPAVLAFGHGANTIHCLANAGKANHGAASSHDADHHGTVSHDADHPGDGPSPSSDHKMTCCGLFCLSALATELGILDSIDEPSAPAPADTLHFYGRVPERLDRPPIPVPFV